LEHVELFVAHSWWFRLTSLYLLLRIVLTRRVDLAEVYPYAELPLMMVLILRLARVPVLLIARGQEYRYMSGRMSLRRRLTFRWTYALAPYVVYREPYMEAMLEGMGKRDVWFLPNAVPMPAHSRKHREDACHFLFLNAVNDVRHPAIALDAFLRLCAQCSMADSVSVRLHIVGLRRKHGSAIEAQKAEELHGRVAGKDVPVELHTWSSEPERWLDDADVFLLPADVVFLNFSLLEAMARGVPPIVQNVPGAERIVTHGESGYILPLAVDAWAEHMRRLVLDPELRQRLGQAARHTVSQHYSLDTYLERYDGIYREILAR
jgi:glycosyltransferase involved in cell wall biosynthesis